MQPEVMQERYAAFRRQAMGLFASLRELCADVAGEELAGPAQALQSAVEGPFLFVVVGEVKAGKSSFINALLGEPMCAVAPDPCTDAIHKIVFAAERREVRLSEHVRELGLPVDILRDVAIVDTPGTNSIIAHHQEITERFIPEADLVIFVFPALNPYSRTAWDFLDFVHESWRKKVIFVLQQADRASPEELSVNRRRVAEYAAERGIEAARIFPVSAKLALAGQPDSGMEDVWAYIRATVTGGRHYRLKMESLTATARELLQRAGAALTQHRAVLEEDQAEEQRIQGALRRGREYSRHDVELLAQKLLEVYGRLAEEATHDLRELLSLGNLVRTSLGGLFRGGNPLRTAVEDLLHRFNDRVVAQVEGVSAESSGLITATVIEVVEGILAELRGGRGRPAGLNIPALTARRLEVVASSADNVLKLLRGESLSDRLRPRGLSRLGDTAVMGGFLTAVGAVMAATAHAVIFDVTGGIFTTVGALLAINTLAFQRRSVVRRFGEGLAEGRARFEAELAEKLQAQMDAVYAEISQAFAPLVADIRDREVWLRALEQRLAGLAAGLDGLSQGLADLPAVDAEAVSVG